MSKLVAIRVSEDEYTAFERLRSLNITKNNRALFRNMMAGFTSTALEALGEKRRFLLKQQKEYAEKTSIFDSMNAEEKALHEQDIFAHKVYCMKNAKNLEAASALIDGLTEAANNLEQLVSLPDPIYSIPSYGETLITNYMANTDKVLRKNLKQNGLLNADCAEEDSE